MPPEITIAADPAVTLPVLPVAAKEPRPPVASALHTIGLLALIVITFNLQPVTGPDLAAPPPSHYWRILLVDWLVVAYVAYGLRRRGLRLRDLVGWVGMNGQAFFADVVLAVVILLANFIIAIGVTLVLGRTHPRGYVDPAIPSLIPHGPLGVATMILACITAGICEEIIFRGYLQRQFVGWTKSPAAGIVITGVIFAGGHLYHGFRGAMVIGLYSMVWGVVAMWRQSLRPLMLAHVTQDLLASLLLYLVYLHQK